jgi:hypothetical protein
MGMKMRSYWAINYLFDFILYVLVCAIFVGLEVLLQARFFWQSR